LKFSEELHVTREPRYPLELNGKAVGKRIPVENMEFSRIIAGPCHTGVVGHFITMVSTFSGSRAHAFEAYASLSHHEIHKRRGPGSEH